MGTMTRHLLPLAIGALVFAGCSEEPSAGDGERSGPPSVDSPRSNGPVVVGDSAVGCLEIGAPSDVVRRLCDSTSDTTIQREGSPQPAMSVDVGQATVLAEMVDGTVWRITVEDSVLATHDSISVGTPLRKLADLPGIRIVHGEGAFALTDAHCGKSFRVEGLPSRAGGWSAEELRRLPDTVRVGRILVLGQCDTVADPPPDAAGGTVHEYAYLEDEVRQVLAFLRGGPAIPEGVLADSVTLAIAADGGGDRVTRRADELHDRTAWRVGDHDLIPPEGYEHTTLSPGLHWNCMPAGLEARFPTFAGRPHVGVRLAEAEDAPCLRTWNATFVFGEDAEAPRLIAVLYDQWEW